MNCIFNYFEFLSCKDELVEIHAIFDIICWVIIVTYLFFITYFLFYWRIIFIVTYIFFITYLFVLFKDYLHQCTTHWYSLSPWCLHCTASNIIKSHQPWILQIWPNKCRTWLGTYHWYVKNGQFGHSFLTYSKLGRNSKTLQKKILNQFFNDYTCKNTMCL